MQNKTPDNLPDVKDLFKYCPACKNVYLSEVPDIKPTSHDAYECGVLDEANCASCMCDKPIVRPLK